MLKDIKIKRKKTEAELGHSDRLKIYVDPNKIYVKPAFKSRKESPFFLAEILYRVYM